MRVRGTSTIRLALLRALIHALAFALASTVTFAQKAAAPDAQIAPVPQWQIAAGGHQEFDVASVRENKDPDAPSSINVPHGVDDNYHPTAGVFSTKNYPLQALIAFAYKIDTSQSEVYRASLPDWARGTAFDVEARTDNRNVTKDQLRLMVQSLLADRFKIVVHHETRQVSVYAAVLVKPGVLGPGLRLHPADEPCSAITPNPGAAYNQPSDSSGSPPPTAPTTLPGGFPTRCGVLVNTPSPTQYHRHESARNVPLSIVFAAFSGMGNLGRPVVDQTGLTGNFDWVMDFLDERPSMNPPPDAEGPTFQEALKNQAGLKLVSEKAPFDFVIVDHIEHPSAN